MTPPHPIRFGVFTGVAQTTWPNLLEVWQRTEEMGFDTGWVPDHFYAGYGDPAGPCFEAGTVLAAVAASTRRIGVGPLVLSNTFRHPAVLANMAASLDHVAAGRFTLGLGAGWLQSEHDGYALPFGTTRDRIERLDENARAAHLVLADATWQALDQVLAEHPVAGERYPAAGMAMPPRSTARWTSNSPRRRNWAEVAAPATIPSSCSRRAMPPASSAR